MACHYGVALEVLRDKVWFPQDQTRSYWYRKGGEFYYSDNDDVPNPEEWSGGGYSSERARCYVERDGYVIVALDDGCGGDFQAFFTKAMEIDPDDYE